MASVRGVQASASSGPMTLAVALADLVKLCVPTSKSTVYRISLNISWYWAKARVDEMWGKISRVKEQSVRTSRPSKDLPTASNSRSSTLKKHHSKEGEREGERENDDNEEVEIPSVADASSHPPSDINITKSKLDMKLRCVRVDKPLQDRERATIIAALDERNRRLPSAYNPI